MTDPEPRCACGMTSAEAIADARKIYSCCACRRLCCEACSLLLSTGEAVCEKCEAEAIFK